MQHIFFYHIAEVKVQFSKKASGTVNYLKFSPESSLIEANKYHEVLRLVLRLVFYPRYHCTSGINFRSLF